MDYNLSMLRVYVKGIDYNMLSKYVKGIHYNLSMLRVSITT